MYLKTEDELMDSTQKKDIFLAKSIGDLCAFFYGMEKTKGRAGLER